jgi:endoglycosylceramidase
VRLGKMQTRGAPCGAGPDGGAGRLFVGRMPGWSRAAGRARTIVRGLGAGLLGLVVVHGGLGGPAAGAAPAGTTQPIVQGPFRTQGLFVLDSAGRRLFLRGLDVSGDEYVPTGAPLPYGPATFRQIRATGATVVRVPIAWANIEPRRGVFDEAALARVRKIVSWAADAGLLVVLDMHQYDWSPCFGGNGVPAWAVPGCPRLATGPASVLAAAPAETAFFLDRSLEEQFAKAWAQVALAVKGDPAVLGYDLFNEPPAGLVPPGVFEATVLPAFYRLVAHALRRVDPHALVFVEPAWLHSAATPASSFLGPIGLPDIVYAPHEYGTSLDDGAGDVADLAGPGQFVPWLAMDRRQARRLHAAVWIGEWGDVNPTSAFSIHPYAYVRDMLTAQDEELLGSAYWSSTPSSTPGSWPYTARIAAELSRIAPAAVAGDPVRISTGRRTLSFVWKAAPGTTLVSLPSGVHPVVEVLRGKVSSRLLPGDWLALRAPAGELASVVVEAGGGGT